MIESNGKEDNRTKWYQENVHTLFSPFYFLIKLPYKQVNFSIFFQTTGNDHPINAENVQFLSCVDIQRSHEKFLTDLDKMPKSPIFFN